MLFYEEIRNKMKCSNKSSNKNNITQKNIKKKPSFFNNNKTEKEPFSNKNNINNIKKSNSFFMSKKLQELKNAPNYIGIKKENKIENNKKYMNKPNKKYSYTFQSFYNNYPRPEPLPKKIDIRIINNSSTFSTSNINETSNRYKTRSDKTIYDDKKILFILTNLGLENLYIKFKDNFITYNDLNFLTKDDFIEMKIPIGPRNRIIHFIRELKKNGMNINFDELRNFIHKYKESISGKNTKINENNIYDENILDLNNKYIYNKKSQNNSSVLSSAYESEKNENISFLEKNKNDNKNNISFFSNTNYNKSNINILREFYNFKNIENTNKNNKKKNYSSEKQLENIEISENEKVNQLNQIINDINYKIKSNSYIFDNKNNSNKYKKPNTTKNIGNIKKNNYIYNNNITYNYEYVKSPHLQKNNSNFSKYNSHVPKIKNRSKNIKSLIIKDKSLSLSRNSKNEVFHSFNHILSKNLLNKLEIINKEVEKYQNNYERLKNETKRRNKNVIRILSCNSFFFKNKNGYINSNNDENIDYFGVNDLLIEKERNLKNEIKNDNVKDNDSEFYIDNYFGNNNYKYNK